MRKHVSVLMLHIRSVIYRFLAVLALLAAAQGGLFYLYLTKNPTAALDQALTESRIHWAFGVGFVLISVLLCGSGCERTSRQGYTLRRLQISEKWVYFWQAVCNAGWYLLLWAAELGIVLALCGWYMTQADPAAVSHQTVFLASYRSEFFHALLPLDDVTRWIYHGVMCLCLGITTAAFPYWQRRRSVGYAAILTAAFSLFTFCRAVGSFDMDILFSLVLLTPAALTVTRVVGEGDVYDEA